jgi:homoserine O-acetyltransferase
MKFWKAVIGAAIAIALIPLAALAADFPAPKEGSWIARDFKFHTGEVMPELRLAYTTVGEPTGEPVLVLHGTTGSAASVLAPSFGGELFGKGQPLDASKYFIIIPDAVGHGKSAKPSDGLRAKFPRYNYDDMVEAQHRLIKEGLGIRHLRLVLGNSMGGMHTWYWGVKYPDYMDALVPMASQPSEMASRNWMLRRLLIDTIRSDPDYNDGNYTAQPRSMQRASVFFAIATNGGTLAFQKIAPTRHINSADDERNPPETGIMERALKRVKNGRLYLIPASEETQGHGTTGRAKLWSQQLHDFLQSVPKRAM